METKFKSWKSQDPSSWFSCNPGKNGFLPIGKPLEKLPSKFHKINEILDQMKLDQKDSLLKKNQLAYTIDQQLPIYDLSEETNIQLLTSLFRDFCFLSSAYSLELSHYNLKNGVYGEARDYLPPNLTKPLLFLSKKLNCFPWLDYAYGYGLNNAILKNGCDPGRYDSYKTCRMFNGNDSESGFINVHIAMVSYSGELLDYQQKILEYASKQDFKKLDKIFR